MRTLKLFLASVLAWSCAYAAPGTATLTGPDEVPLSGSVYPLWKFPLELDIRWEDEIPLTLDLYLIEGRLKTGGEGLTFSFQDQSGKKAQLGDIIGSYAPPPGEIRIYKGQTIKIGLSGHGGVTVSPGERYTVTVTLYGRVKDQIATIQGSKELVFVKVSPEEKKPNQVPEPTSGLAPGRGSS